MSQAEAVQEVVYAISEFDQFRATMAEIQEKCDFIPDMTTKDGYEKSKKLALAVRKSINAVENRRKEIKADVIKRGKLIDSEAREIMDPLAEWCKPHQEAYQKVDKDKKEAKQRRLDEQQARVDVIAQLPALMIDSDSEGIRMCMEDLRNNDCEGFNEHTEAALTARKNSLETLQRMYSEKLSAEIAKVQLEELEAKRAEEEQARRIEEENARIERERAEKLMAEQQRKIDQLEAEKAAKERAEQEAEAARERAELKAEADRLAKQVAAEQAAAEEEARIAYEAEKAARLEADQQHRSVVIASVEESLVNIGLTEKEAKIVVKAISNGDIPHLVFNMEMEKQ